MLTLQNDLVVALPSFPDAAIIATLNGILDGTIVPSKVGLMEGLALRLYHLVFKLKPSALKVTSWSDYYTVLGTITHGGRVQATKTAVKRLQSLLERKSEPVGLYKHVAEQLHQRQSDPINIIRTCGRNICANSPWEIPVLSVYDEWKPVTPETGVADFTWVSAPAPTTRAALQRSLPISGSRYYHQS